MLETVTKQKFVELKEEVEHLKENIALLSNPELLEKIKEARARLSHGEGISLEDVEKDILRE